MKSSKRNSYVTLFNIILIIIATVFVLGMRSADAAAREKINNTYLNVELEATQEVVKLDVNSGIIKLEYLVEEYADVEPTPYIELTDAEVRDLAALVYLESGIESYDCQCAVASVVINRMTTRNMTLHDVIYEKNQFTPAYRVSSTEPSESARLAAEYVVMNGPTLPEYVTFFRADYYFDWVTPYTYVDHTYFSYDENVMEMVMR